MIVFLLYGYDNLLVVLQLLNHAKSWCNTMNYSTPEIPVLHYLPELTQTHIHWVSDAIQPSHSVTTFFSCSQSFPLSGSFSVSQIFTSGSQSVRASVSASGLPMNIQGWFPLELTGLISLLSKGLSRVFSSTTVQKHQFFRAQSSLWSNFHVALTRQTFVGKVMPLLFNRLSRFVIASLSRS